MSAIDDEDPPCVAEDGSDHGDGLSFGKGAQRMVINTHQVHEMDAGASVNRIDSASRSVGIMEEGR